MRSRALHLRKRWVFLLFIHPLLSACPIKDLDYLWHVSQGQLDLLSQRVPIEQALKEANLSEEAKNKLRLIDEIKNFVQDHLELEIDENIYSSYVQLEEPYVSWLIRVSPAYQLKAFKWSFPFVGSVPYKGFFNREMAEQELENFPKEHYDTYLRGVRAYSTLSWFEDPILSSMLDMSESGFAKMIFHELAHTVLFFKNHVDFNERFAEWLAGKALLLFYLEREGKESKTVKKIKLQEEDTLLFSDFIEKEYLALKSWYERHNENLAKNSTKKPPENLAEKPPKKQPKNPIDKRQNKRQEGRLTPALKQKRLKEIQARFLTEIRPKLKTASFLYFSKIKLNNAVLLSHRSYNYKMDDFERIFHLPKVNQNIKAFVSYCAQFEKEKNPEAALKKAANESALKK